MPWVRIDDHFDEHPKLAAIGPVGWGVWLAGLAYCNRNLTDGFIPYAVAEGIGGSWRIREPIDDEEEIDNGVRMVRNRERVWSIDIGSGMHGEGITTDWVISHLVRVGLWEAVPGGYLIHDYGEYQPTKAQVVALRATKAAAGQAGGQASAIARGKAPATAPAKPSGRAKSNPVPKPVPVPVSESNTGSAPLSSAREGLPNLDDAAIAALEERTGRTWSQAGQRQLSEYDELIEAHGLEAVCGAMDSLREGKPMTARQLVWGAMKLLEPMPSTRAPADHSIEEKSRKPRVLEPWEQEFRDKVEAENAKLRGDLIIKVSA